ncbi:MAG: PEGA domain-containing protein [Deltaproteobacteria bacterium]|nr:PEGA domain-containing protein [Deltaproteobacteria bacterium]MCB9490110.1 PEGA domain-containing protein [Deltaproteobacteria bacterium]
MMNCRKFLALLVALLATALSAGPVHAAATQVESFFGTFVFAHADQKIARAGFVEFHTDHTWTRVMHVDTNGDAIPDDINVTKGAFKVVADGADGVLSIKTDDGRDVPFGDVHYRRGSVESFTMDGDRFTRKSELMPYFAWPDHSVKYASRLVVTTDPPGALVYVNGRAMASKTPLIVEKPQANVKLEVRVEMADHLPQTRTVRLKDGERGELKFELLGGDTQLWVKTDPATRIEIDGIYKGTSPLKLEDLAPGEHRVAMSLPALDLREETSVYLQPGEVNKVYKSFTGFLKVDVGRPVAVSIRKELDLGDAPGDALELPVGQHVILLKDATGDVRRALVSVKLGETTTLVTPFESLDKE